MHGALRRESKDGLARNLYLYGYWRLTQFWVKVLQDNVSEWGDMSIHGMLLQWASTIKQTQLSVLD